MFLQAITISEIHKWTFEEKNTLFSASEKWRSNIIASIEYFIISAVLYPQLIKVKCMFMMNALFSLPLLILLSWVFFQPS